MNDFFTTYADTSPTGRADHAHVQAEAGAETEDDFYITLSQRLGADGSPLIVDPPRHYHGAAEPGAPEFIRPVDSAVSTMCLMAARTEFLTAQAH